MAKAQALWGLAAVPRWDEEKIAGLESRRYAVLRCYATS